MVCNAYVIKFPARRKGSGKPYTKHKLVAVADIQIRNPEFTFTVEEANKVQRCGGKIIARVEAIDEPSWGDHNAVLEVEFKCAECGCTHHPGLPDKYTIREFLTSVVEKMD